MQHSTKTFKLSSHARKARFLARTHPRKHAQKAIFPLIYGVFLHIGSKLPCPTSLHGQRQQKRQSVSNAFRPDPPSATCWATLTLF